MRRQLTGIGLREALSHEIPHHVGRVLLLRDHPRPLLERWLSRAGDLSAVAVERPGALVEVHDFIGDG